MHDQRKNQNSTDCFVNFLWPEKENEYVGD